MLRAFVRTDASYASLALRLMLAAVVFPHGAQKLLGWYGGTGLDATMAFFASIGVPTPLALLVVFSDFFGALALAIGLGGRLAAFGTAAVLMGAIALVHGQYGFFINWFGTQQGEGIQFHLLAIVIAVVLMAKGSGVWSLDRLLAGGAPAAPAPSEAAGPTLLRAA